MLLNKILKILFVITLVLLIISLGFKSYLFDFNLYKKELTKFNVYEKIPDADEHVFNLIKFMHNKEELNDFYNEKEKLHLEDVKNLFRKSILIFNITLILTILFLIYFIYTKNYKIIYSAFLISGLIVILFALLFFIVDFDYFFIKFHLIAFDNDLWQLNPDEDNLINLFPQELQHNIAKRIFINILISSLILIIIAIVLMKFKVNKSFLKNKI